jgi:hypothetical protein
VRAPWSHKEKGGREKKGKKDEDWPRGEGIHHGAAEDTEDLDEGKTGKGKSGNRMKE